MKSATSACLVPALARDTRLSLRPRPGIEPSTPTPAGLRSLDGTARARFMIKEERSTMTSDPAAEIERDKHLLAQARESFGRVVYSHKIHEKQADLYFRKHRWQQAALVAFTAISTGTFLASLLGYFVKPQIAGLATSFIAIVVTTLSLGAKSFKFSEESEAHRDTASRLWDVRESYLSLISDLMSGAISHDEARARRDALQEAARAAYSAAPRTSNKAFKKARDGLKNNEEMTFTPREIDLFLPAALRIDESEA